eukprot:3830963-Rhodomonas_salina.1
MSMQPGRMYPVLRRPSQCACALFRASSDVCVLTEPMGLAARSTSTMSKTPSKTTSRPVSRPCSQYTRRNHRATSWFFSRVGPDRVRRAGTSAHTPSGPVGADEVNSLAQALHDTPTRGTQGLSLSAAPLYAALPMERQLEAFAETPPGGLPHTDCAGSATCWRDLGGRTRA